MAGFILEIGQLGPNGPLSAILEAPRKGELSERVKRPELE